MRKKQKTRCVLKGIFCVHRHYTKKSFPQEYTQPKSGIFKESTTYPHLVEKKIHFLHMQYILCLRKNKRFKAKTKNFGDFLLQP